MACEKSKHWKISGRIPYCCSPDLGVAVDKTLFTNFVVVYILLHPLNLQIKSLVAQHPHTMTHMHSFVLMSLWVLLITT